MRLFLQCQLQWVDGLLKKKNWQVHCFSGHMDLCPLLFHLPPARNLKEPRGIVVEYVHWKLYDTYIESNNHTYIESSANTMSYLVMLDFNGSMIFVLSHKMHIHSGSVDLLHKRCFSFQTWRSLIPFISHLHERSKGRHSHAIMPFSAGPR